MLTKKKTNRLSYEILGLFLICFLLAFVLYFFLSVSAIALVENYCWKQEIVLNEDEMYHLDHTVFNIGLFLSIAFFVILFLVLFGERLAYIRTIIKGVETLQGEEYGYIVPIEGNNELTELAKAVNYLAETRRAVKEKEEKLQKEKEDLIRTLSHDIRTPLTSILSYSELLASKENTVQEYREYLSLVRKKALQIKDLTDILLDGGKRELVYFPDARFLMEQLMEEFEETLEDIYEMKTDLSACPAFSASFDVTELRRIFDNLISNIQKYADSSQPVCLSILKNEKELLICQKNAVKNTEKPPESYGVGLQSIRRIIYNYGGTVSIIQNETYFEIKISFPDIFQNL